MVEILVNMRLVVTNQPDVVVNTPARMPAVAGNVAIIRYHLDLILAAILQECIIADIEI
jgi:hypothetical protein